MDQSQDNLGELYAEWHRATDAEGRAIQAGDWSAVEEWQQCKADLKDRILPAAEAFQSRWPVREQGQVEYERTFRPIVSELIALEHRNHAWLRLRRDSANTEMQALQDTTRNLRGVHRAYGRGQQTNWQSYS
jgi:hypothetical protein